MLQHGFLDDWTYLVRTLQDHVSRVMPALLWELNALPGAGESCGGGKAPWEIVRNYVYLGKYEASGLWRIREMVKETFKEDGVMDQQPEGRLDRPVDEQTCVTHSVVDGQTRVAVHVNGHSIWAWQFEKEEKKSFWRPGTSKRYKINECVTCRTT